mgnify:CR=1 FL=1
MLLLLLLLLFAALSPRRRALARVAQPAAMAEPDDSEALGGVLARLRALSPLSYLY